MTEGTLTARRGAAKKTKATARDLELLDRWLGGRSYRSIAAMPDITVSHVAIKHAVDRALERLTEEHVEKALHSQAAAVARIDLHLAAVWDKALEGEVPSVREARRLVELRSKITGDLAGELPELPFDLSRLAEVQGETIVQVLVLVLGSSELGLPPEKQELARRLAGQQIRQISGTAERAS
jgi:hypothetical protein